MPTAGKQKMPASVYSRTRNTPRKKNRACSASRALVLFMCSDVNTTRTTAQGGGRTVHPPEGNQRFQVYWGQQKVEWGGGGTEGITLQYPVCAEIRFSPRQFGRHSQRQGEMCVQHTRWHRMLWCRLVRERRAVRVHTRCSIAPTTSLQSIVAVHQVKCVCGLNQY